MVWYSHLFKDFPQFVVMHTKVLAVNEAEVDVFFFVPGILLLLLWSNGCGQNGLLTFNCLDSTRRTKTQKVVLGQPNILNVMLATLIM